MRYDMVKVEELVLALLGVFEFENGRVWKRYDFANHLSSSGKSLPSSPMGSSTRGRRLGTPDEVEH